MSILIDEYRRVLDLFIDVLWEIEDISKFLPSSITFPISSKTWLSAQQVQCVGKQASGIIRGVRQKQKQRLFIINKLIDANKLKAARKLQKIYDETSISKPIVKFIEPELDSRFIKIDFESETSFDGWITIHSLRSNSHKEMVKEIILPFKKHKHFEKMDRLGKMKGGCRLSKSMVTFNFGIDDPEVKQNGEIIGIDVGFSTTLSCSDGVTINEDVDGYTYEMICKKLARKKVGSKSFERTVTHRKNYLGWCINQLNLKNVRQVNRENIKGMKTGKRSSRVMKHWSYADIFDKLDSKCNELGVRVNLLNPTYTSQRCGACGWVRKGNRDRKNFKCDRCGYTADADLNASRNISLDLEEITPKERLLHKNLKGFYWNEKQFIVAST